MLLTCNIWKHPNSEYKGNNEWKQKKIKNKKINIDHGLQCLHFKKKTKKKKKKKKISN